MHIFVSVLIFIMTIPIQFSLSYAEYVLDPEVCYRSDDPLQRECLTTFNPARYILYDVNPSEGFNLRRDVYRRFAVLARNLAASSDPKLKNFKLVLPPWSHLYHWSYSEKAELIPWGYYFDLASLKSYAPVIEMYEFFQEYSRGKQNIIIDEVYNMQNWEEMMKTGKFTYKWEIKECKEEEPINYFYYTNVSSNNVKCLKFHGTTNHLIDLLQTSRANTIFFTHAEVALHPTFGDASYWRARRSLRFNKELTAVARAFRRSYLSSTDEADNINQEPRWEYEKIRRDAVGGPYLAIHLRRRDFFIGRPKELPTLQSVAQQVTKYLQDYGLSVVFLATDAPYSDVEALQYYLPKNILLLKFIPEKRFLEKYRDGGAAIIDQLLCAHSRFFLGTSESTFTFRIFEEREMLGFPSENTFNVVCPDPKNCKRPTMWKLVH